MKTNGGYEIKNFKILENPIEMQFPENNHYYSGEVNVPMLEDKLQPFTLTWDKFGRVNNPKRWNDCNIKICNKSEHSGAISSTGFCSICECVAFVSCT